MECSLCKLKKEIPINWIGSDGSKYDIEKFRNWGIGGLGNFYRGKEDLPMHLYPYTIEYKTTKLFDSCNNH